MVPTQGDFDLVKLWNIGVTDDTFVCPVITLKVANVPISFQDVVKAAFVEFVVNIALGLFVEREIFDLIFGFDTDAEEPFMSKLCCTVVVSI